MSARALPVSAPGGAVQRAFPVRLGVVLAAVCLLALALRTYGVAFGLPAVYNQDETSIMSRALAFAKGDPNPHNFLYPTLYFYVLFAWIGAYFVVARALGVVDSVRHFQVLFFTDPTQIYLAGRALTALCGTVTVAIVYRVGRDMRDWRAGLAAALFVAVAPVAVADAHYVKHDVPVALAGAVLLLAVARILKAPPRQPLPRARVVAGGIAFGVACALHYYAVFLAVPLLVAIAAHDRWRSPRETCANLARAALTSGATFFVCSPFVLLDWRTAVADIVANRQVVVDRAVVGQRAFASVGRYVELLWGQAMGWPVAVLAVVGLVLLLQARRWTLAAVLGSFPLVFLAFISNTVPATRYLNPVVPFLALAAGCAVSWIASRRRARYAALAVAVAAAVPGLWLSLRTDRFFSQTDTRTLALSFIESHVPSGSTILVQPYSVPLYQSRDSVREALIAHLGSTDRVPRKFALRLSVPDGARPAYRTIYLGEGGLDLDKVYIGYKELDGSCAALHRLGVDYVVLKRYDRTDAPTGRVLDTLSGQAERIAVISPYREGALPNVPPFLHNTDAIIRPELLRPGPIVEVWKLRTAGATHG